MKKNISILFGGLLVAILVVGALGAVHVYAQGPTDAPLHGRGPGGGHGFGLGDAELEAAAKALGMTTDELSSALKDGKTLRDLADAAGVDIEAVHAAIQAVHISEMRERIAQAVEDGTMTQEKADWLLEGLDKGFLGGPGGFGFGHGPKGNGQGQPPFSPPNQFGVG